MPEPDWNTLKTEVSDGVLTITLNRPESLNAYTVEMSYELEAAFHDANIRDDVRAVIVTGAGRAFCAGMDLSVEGNVFGLDESLSPTLDDMADLDDPAIARVRDSGGRVTLAIHECRKPVIAAINGAAVGIGATMTLAMDARLVSTSARVGFVFGRIGIVPEAASSWFLPRVVGLPTALDLVFSAEVLDARGALEVGLARSIHDPDDLLDSAHELADRWTLGRSQVSTALARQLLYRNSALSNPADAHRVDSLGMFYTSIADGAEGVQAFREKRDARFARLASDDMPPFYDDWISTDGGTR